MALHVLDGADAGLLFPGDAEFAQTVEASVGFDLDEEVIARSVEDGKGLYIGYFHLVLLGEGYNIRTSLDLIKTELAQYYRQQP